MATSGMELDIWSGDWGLPSIDHNCLAVMAYCKFSSVPIKVEKANNPWRSPSGDLPILHQDDTVLAKVPEILSFLRGQNLGTDYDLSTKQSADIVAFNAMLEEKLLPALTHLWWVDKRVYPEMTRPWFARQLPFPHCYYIPLKKHKQCQNNITDVYGGEDVTENDIETKLYKEAKECLNYLSAKLGENDYFFGSTPSSLDAVVFGFLAPLLKAPFPNTTLQNHLKGCVNLCQHCHRILNNYFPVTPEEAEAERKREEEARAKRADVVDFPHRRKNMMVSGMVALTAMVGYAFLSGMVAIPQSNRDNGNQLEEPQTNTTAKSSKTPNFNQFERLFEETATGSGQRSSGPQEGQRDENAN